MDDEEQQKAYYFYQTLPRRLHIVSMVIYSLAFVLGVLGNGLVIIITGFRMKRTVNTIWFLNLAIADFAFTFFLPLSVAYAALGFHWPFGLAMCKINSTLAFINLYTSVYLLMVISIDRCISVRCPVWAHNHRKPQLASFVAIGVWILALVLSSPNLFFRDTLLNPRNVTICFSNYGETERKARRTQHAMIISRFIFGFVIPFSVIVFCYGAIVLKLRTNRLTQSNKPFKIITAVIVTFFVCWLPYHIFSFIELKADEQPNVRLVLIIGIPLASSLAFVNSCLNPILYVFMGQDFKERMRRSILSAFENAFTEDGSQSTTLTKPKSSGDIECQNL